MVARLVIRGSDVMVIFLAVVSRACLQFLTRKLCKGLRSEFTDVIAFDSVFCNSKRDEHSRIESSSKENELKVAMDPSVCKDNNVKVKRIGKSVR